MPNGGEPYLSLTTNYSPWAPAALLGEINAVVTCGTLIDLRTGQIVSHRCTLPKD